MRPCGYRCDSLLFRAPISKLGNPRGHTHTTKPTTFPLAECEIETQIAVQGAQAGARAGDGPRARRRRRRRCQAGEAVLLLLGRRGGARGGSAAAAAGGGGGRESAAASAWRGDRGAGEGEPVRRRAPAGGGARRERRRLARPRPRARRLLPPRQRHPHQESRARQQATRSGCACGGEAARGLDAGEPPPHDQLAAGQLRQRVGQQEEMRRPGRAVPASPAGGRSLPESFRPAEHRRRRRILSPELQREPRLSLHRANRSKQCCSCRNGDQCWSEEDE